MAEYYPSQETENMVDNISGLFAQNVQPNNQLESIQWESYLKVYNSLQIEKFNRNRSFDIAFKMVIRWASMSKTSHDYLQMVEMWKMMWMLAGRTGFTEEIGMKEYQKNNIKMLTDTIALYLKYSDAINVVERKKFDYALKFRGLDRLDVPVPERFGKQDVADYLNSMISKRDSFDKNIEYVRGFATKYPDDESVITAVNHMINFFIKEKENFQIEVEYFQNLCAELDVAGYRK